MMIFLFIVIKKAAQKRRKKEMHIMSLQLLHRLRCWMFNGVYKLDDDQEIVMYGGMYMYHSNLKDTTHATSNEKWIK